MIFNKGDESAFPNQPKGTDGLPSHEPAFGLSKREYFAAMAMYGFIAGIASSLNEMKDPNNFDFKALAKVSYAASDALIQAGAQDE